MLESQATWRWRWLGPLFGLLAVVVLFATWRLPTALNEPLVVGQDEEDVVTAALWPEKNFKYGGFLGLAYRYPLLAHMTLNHWDLAYPPLDEFDYRRFLAPAPLLAKKIIRVENLLFFVGSLVLTFLLAVRFLSPWWSVAATALLALTPVYSAYSRIVKSEGLLTFLVLLAVWLSLLGMRRRIGFLLGAAVAAGLAFAVKYSAMAMLPPLVALGFWGFRAHDRRRTIAYAALLAATWSTAVLATWPEVFTAASRLPEMAAQYTFPLPSFLKIVPHKLRYTYVVYSLTFFLPFSFGWLMAPLGTAGLAWLTRLKSPERWVLLVFPFTHLAVFELADMRMWNNVLPVAPFFAIAAAMVMERIAARRLAVAVVVLTMMLSAQVYGTDRIYQMYHGFQEFFFTAKQIAGDEFSVEALRSRDLCIFMTGMQNQPGAAWQSDTAALVETLKTERCKWIVAVAGQFEAHRKFGGPEFTWVGDFPDRVRRGQTGYRGISEDCPYPTHALAGWLDPDYRAEDFFIILRRGGLEKPPPYDWKSIGAP